MPAPRAPSATVTWNVSYISTFKQSPGPPSHASGLVEMNPQSPGNPRISEESESFNSPPIPLNPLAALNGKYTSYLNGDLDDEEDDDIADQGSRALLGSHEGTRGRERVAKFATGLWPQIKGIVIEVRSRSLVFYQNETCSSRLRAHQRYF